MPLPGMLGASTFPIKAGFDFRHRCWAGHSHSPAWLQGLDNSRCAVSLSWLGWSCRRSSGKLRPSSVKSQALLCRLSSDPASGARFQQQPGFAKENDAGCSKELSTLSSLHCQAAFLLLSAVTGLLGSDMEFPSSPHSRQQHLTRGCGVPLQSH